MSTNLMSNEFMSKILDDEAWSELSSEIAWNETILEKYKDKLNWQAISDNDHILWTLSMLSKFRKYIDWYRLSRSGNVSVVGNPEILEQFKNDFNWNELSRNCHIKLSYELIDRFIDLWDWSELIDRYSDEELYSFDFMEKYLDRIPSKKLQDSHLWERLVEERKQSLLNSALQ